MNQSNLSAFIWSVADLLRGDYKQSDYGKVRGGQYELTERSQLRAAECRSPYTLLDQL